MRTVGVISTLVADDAQIHGIMKEKQDLDCVTVRLSPDAEHDEMTPIATLAGDMKREKVLANIVPLFCTRGGRAAGQVIQRRR
jgi:hypothetical protein